MLGIYYFGGNSNLYRIPESKEQMSRRLEKSSELVKRANEELRLARIVPEEMLRMPVTI